MGRKLAVNLWSDMALREADELLEFIQRGVKKQENNNHSQYNIHATKPGILHLALCTTLQEKQMSK